jgi:hypothetical protein
VHPRVAMRILHLAPILGTKRVKCLEQTSPPGRHPDRRPAQSSPQPLW